MGYTEWDHMRALNTHAPNTPSIDWPPIDAINTSSVMTEPEVLKSNFSSCTPLELPQTVGDAQPADSPWVSWTTRVIPQANFPLAPRL
jgi:hypothetical protein